MIANDPKVTLNSVVQISPEVKSHIDTGFAGAFLLVTDLLSWGVMGFVATLGGRGTLPGEAYYRVKWDDVEYVGQAAWAPVVEESGVEEINPEHS